MKTLTFCASRLWLLVLGFTLSLTAADFHSGDRVAVSSSNTSGVPVRSSPDATRYSRWPNGTTAVVVEDRGQWVQVEVNGSRGWLLEKYITALESAPENGEETPSISIGAWNLEHFHDGEERGFPELMGANALPPRTDSDNAAIAAAIRDRLRVSVIMLSEIAGVSGKKESVELARLCSALGPSWRYAIGAAGGIGGGQRVAIVYDDTKVENLSFDEIPIPKENVDGGDIFDRDPLVGYFRVRQSDGRGVDFMVVALHLASGQDKVANHNLAMKRLREKLHAFFAARPALQNERDILIGGDMNASRYDSKKEDFWENYDSAGFAFTTLSPTDGDEYRPTRVKGNPLFPGSQIDYLFASGELVSKLVLRTATVHHELASDGDFLGYRRRYSDHFPITIDIVTTAP